MIQHAATAMPILRFGDTKSPTFSAGKPRGGRCHAMSASCLYARPKPIYRLAKNGLPYAFFDTRALHEAEPPRKNAGAIFGRALLMTLIFQRIETFPGHDTPYSAAYQPHYICTTH